jgi:hypothetical protein
MMKKLFAKLPEKQSERERRPLRAVEWQEGKQGARHKEAIAVEILIRLLAEKGRSRNTARESRKK